MAGTGLAPDKKRIKELEDDNRKLSEIEQRRIGEAITQANSIAELRKQLAELREAAGEAKDLLWKMQNVQPYSDEIHYVGALLNTALLQEKGE